MMRKRKKKTPNPLTPNPLTDSPLHFVHGVKALETVHKPILNLSQNRVAHVPFTKDKRVTE